MAVPSAWCRCAWAEAQTGHHARRSRARVRPDPRCELRRAERRRCHRFARRRRAWPARDSRRSALWWQIQLDPDSRSLDAAFLSAVNTAIAEAERFAAAEPERAEAWFYVGAAYGVRAQFRVYSRRAAGRRPRRQADQGSAREGARARSGDARCRVRHRHVSLLRRRRAGDLQVPALPAAAPRRRSRRRARAARTREPAAACWCAAKRSFRSTCSISGTSTSRRRRSRSSAALQQRYPHNPLFHQIEAEILDVYFHDHAASLKASEQLLALAQSRAVFRADIAERVARRNIAQAIDRAATAATQAADLRMRSARRLSNSTTSRHVLLKV